MLYASKGPLYTSPPQPLPASIKSTDSASTSTPGALTDSSTASPYSSPSSSPGNYLSPGGGSRQHEGDASPRRNEEEFFPCPSSSSPCRGGSATEQTTPPCEAKKGSSSLRLNNSLESAESAFGPATERLKESPQFPLSGGHHRQLYRPVNSAGSLAPPSVWTNDNLQHTTASAAAAQLRAKSPDLAGSFNLPATPSTITCASSAHSSPPSDPSTCSARRPSQKTSSGGALSSQPPLSPVFGSASRSTRVSRDLQAGPEKSPSTERHLGRERPAEQSWTFAEGCDNGALSKLAGAAQSNDKLYIESALADSASGLDINGIVCQNSGYTTLHLASACNSIDVVRTLLLDYRTVVLVDVRSAASQHTPLHRAAVKGHLAVVRLLLDVGAAIDATTQWGSTPLHLAATMGHVEVVDELLKRGAKPDSMTQFGSNPLLSATFKLHRKIVSLLLENGADVNQQNQKGYGALHLAVQKQHYPTILLLLHYGANPSLVDNEGLTPLQIANSSKAPKRIVELLQTVKTSCKGQKIGLAENGEVVLLSDGGDGLNADTTVGGAIRNGAVVAEGNAVATTSSTASSREASDDERRQ